MSAVRAVLLDLYDTLAFSEWPAIRAELQSRLGVSEADLLRAYSLTRPARSVGAFGTSEGDIRAVLEAAGVAVDADLVREVAERTEEFLTTGVSLHEDALPALRELRARGLRTAVVSNCDHTTGPVVERLRLGEETDAVVLSFEVGAAKPDAEIYRAALALVGADAGEAVFVDDQARYCDGAAALGMGTFLIRREGTVPLPRGANARAFALAPSAPRPPVEGVSASGDHRVIRDLRALPDLIA